MKDTEKPQESMPDKDKKPVRQIRKRRSNRDWETASFAGLMFALAGYKDRLEEQRAYKLNSRPR